MNSYNAIGGIGKDAELKFTANGDAICNFSFAANTGYGEKAITTWINCSVWGKRAETLAPMLTKGTKVGVTGELTNRPYTAKDGTQKYSLELRVSDLTLLGAKGDSNTPKENNNASQAQPSVDFDDTSIPF
jgi:single-strand DNA-binding protein